MEYWWSILIWPWELFTDFAFGDVAAEWANDLIATLLCWAQMLWCWFYSTLLDFMYEVAALALPEIPNFGHDINAIIPYFEAVDRWIPMTQILGMALIWLPSYLTVRTVYMIVPFFNS